MSSHVSFVWELDQPTTSTTTSGTHEIIPSMLLVFECSTFELFSRTFKCVLVIGEKGSGGHQGLC